MLEDGFEFPFQGRRDFGLGIESVIIQQQVRLKTVKGRGLLSVELQEPAVLEILEGPVGQVIDRKGVFIGRLDQIDAETQEGLVVTEPAQHRRFDVRLLGNAVAQAFQGAVRGIENDRDHRHAVEIEAVAVTQTYSGDAHV